MLIIEVKNKKINNALKDYRRKVRDTQLLRNLRKKRYYTKPSIKRRTEVLKAI